MKFQWPFLILTMSILSACSFNNKFLNPTKLPADVTTLTMHSAEDTTVIHFAENTHQPTFLKNGKDTIELDFTIESVVFESVNGNKLNGWVLKPKNKIPTITLLHFHSNSGFLISQYQAMTPFIEFGFQVFVFDYSGYGFSEGKATRKNVLMDAESAIRYVKGRSDIKDTKLILYGQSLGGHLAAVAGEQRQPDIDGLVIEGSFTSHKDVAAEMAGFFGRILVSEKYSAEQSIRDFNKPVLIIHSTEDEIIPFAMGQELYNNANEPKEFYEIKRRHILGTYYYADRIAQMIIDMPTID